MNGLLQIGEFQDQMFIIFSRVLVLFTAFPVHELAHGLVADRLGDPTPRLQGRLTFNPMAHLEPIGSLALVMFGFGWARPVKVDSSRFKNPKWGMGLTALAGPVANIFMALIAMSFFKLTMTFGSMAPVRFYEPVRTLIEILKQIISINLYLAVFNLLPIPPLDGSRIVLGILPTRAYRAVMRYEQVIYVALVLMLITGILSIPMGIASNWLLRLLYWLTEPLDWLLGRFR